MWSPIDAQAQPDASTKYYADRAERRGARLVYGVKALGLVDMTPDGLPVIDGHTGVDGLTVITGLAGHGLHLGPVLGEIAADLAIDDVTTRPIDAFRFERFRSGAVGSPEMMI